MSHPRNPTNPLDENVWDAFCDQLKRAGRLVLDSAPDDAFDRAEGLRYVGRIAGHALQSFIEDSDPANPSIAGLPKLGGDNPDYVYASAPLSSEYEYRLWGNRGETSFLGFGTYQGDVGTAEGLKLSGYLEGADLESDDTGNFEIRISCNEQPGNWLPMQPGSRQLMVRQSVRDRRTQRLAEFEIERLGAVDAPPALDPEVYGQQIERAGQYVHGAISQFLEWTNHYAARPNQVLKLDEALASNAQGDPSTHYYLGYYELRPGEALQIDLTPPECEYWNLQLCNHWLESLDFRHHDVNVNHHNAVADPQGCVRILAAPNDPGLPNWLDTAGHQRGCIVLRQIGTSTPNDPVCQVVSSSGLGPGKVGVT
ncbi:hypothetical protein MK489_25035 [Myxococcota bacterium]|nr:hypothetical protein [Myxococcota bacterium]